MVLLESHSFYQRNQDRKGNSVLLFDADNNLICVFAEIYFPTHYSVMSLLIPQLGHRSSLETEFL